jgi:hypothetical protein
MYTKRPDFPAIMTVDFIQEYLQYLKRISHDDEAAHGDEDTLWEQVMYSIAQGRCVDPKECCALAIRSQEIEFSRWCA